MTSEEREREFIEEMLSRGDRVEALEWLTDAPPGVHRSMGVLSYDESVLLLRELYKLGAKEVVAVDIKSNPNHESTEHLIATLPDDPEARTAILDFERLREEEMDYDPDDAADDIGQRHLRILFPFWIE